MNFKSAAEFQKDFKKLSRKFKTLDSDLIEFKKVLNESSLGIGRHFNLVTQTESVKIIKVRFFCRYLKGSSLRIIYAYIDKASKVEFIEIYFKGNKVNEDKERIKQYLKESR